MKYYNMERKRVPETPTQMKAWAEGYKDHGEGVKATQNPHMSDVRHIWWRHGWLAAEDDSRE